MLALDVPDHPGEVFLNASWAAGSALGWIGLGVDRSGLEVGQLHPMQPSLHAAARVVRPEVPQGEFADVPDAVLDNPVALDIRAGFYEPASMSRLL
jgi:hypothetical protein